MPYPGDNVAVVCGSRRGGYTIGQHTSETTVLPFGQAAAWSPDTLTGVLRTAAQRPLAKVVKAQSRTSSTTAGGADSRAGLVFSTVGDRIQFRSFRGSSIQPCG